MVKYTLDTNIFVRSLYDKECSIVYYKWVSNDNSILILSVLLEIQGTIFLTISCFLYKLKNQLSQGKSREEAYNSDIGLKFKKNFPNIFIKLKNLNDSDLLNKIKNYLDRIRILHSYLYTKEQFPLSPKDIDVYLKEISIQNKERFLCRIKNVSKNYKKDMKHILLCEKYGDIKKTDVWFIGEDKKDLLSHKEEIERILNYVYIKSLAEWK